MIRSNLINFLNRHWLLQLIFCFLPVLLISIYIFAYMYDVTGLLSVFEYNNRLTKQDMDANNIKEVSLFNENSDGSYSVIIEDSKSIEEDIALGDVIYTVNILGNSWFSITTKSGDVLYQMECDLFEVEQLKDDRFKIIVDDKFFEVNRNDIVCDVKLDKSGDYIIEYSDENDTSKIVDFISSLQVILKNEGSYRLKISSAYKKEIDNVDLKFCTNLPTNNIYYNESTQSFVKNVSDDFSKTFIIGSNILIVLLSMFAYCVLLGIIRNKGELTLLKHKEILIVDICSVSILVLCILFTLVMF